MKVYQYITIAALLALSACSGSDGIEPAATGESSLLRLTATQGHSVSGQVGLTRAEDGLLTASTGFSGTETVKVYFNNLSDDYYVGAADASHVSALYGGMLEYPSDATGTTYLYAVHPAASATVNSHTVAYDQTGNDAYRQSDLMFAKYDSSIDLANTANVYQLDFDHQLVKLKVIVTKGPGIDEITSIKMLNVKRQVSLTPSASALTLGAPETASDGDGDNILIFEGHLTADNEAQTYSVVFPAQTWSETNFLEIIADNHTVIYTLDKAKANWQIGGEYTLTLNLTYAFLDAKVAVAPSDWFDGEVVGLTLAPNTLANLKAWVNRNNDFNSYVGYFVGRNGSIHAAQQTGDVGCIAYVSTSAVDANSDKSRILVVALEDAASVKWGSNLSYSLTDADALNGFSNTNALQAEGQEACPAAYAAYKYAGARPSGASRWFLPSRAQLDHMTDVMRTKLGLTSGAYWSSTESGSTTAWSYSFASTEWSDQSAKSGENAVRACFYY